MWIRITNSLKVCIKENTYLVFRLKNIQILLLLKGLFFWNSTDDVGLNFLKETHNLFVIAIILVLQVVPVHPAAHPKQVPICMWHTLFLQFVGHRSLQLFPYTPEVWQPVTNKWNYDYKAIAPPVIIKNSFYVHLIIEWRNICMLRFYFLPEKYRLLMANDCLCRFRRIN